MGRKKCLQHRRSRSNPFSENSEPEDPIALAIAAKERRHFEAVYRAAEAAARAAPPDITTWLGEVQQPQQSEEQKAAGGGAEAQAGQVEAERITEQHQPKTVQQHLGDGASALASLLGYSPDEHSDEEHRDSPTAAMTENHDGLLHTRSAGEEKGKTLLDDLHETPTANGTAEAPTGVRLEGLDEASDNDDIDEQYASFMGELQSSGLLKDGADASEEESAAAAAAPIVEAEPVGKAEADEVALMAGNASSPQADTDAEQRVLGVLEGAAEWSEVMDMASGQVYFWNSATNEVAWDPPQGSMPRSKQTTDAIFEADKSEEPAQHPADVSTEPADSAEVTAGEGAAAAHSDAQEVAQRSAQLAGRLASALQASTSRELDALPRLAVEAELRARDWETLMQIGALPWPAFERYHCLCLERIESEAATAIASASKTVRLAPADPSEPRTTAPDDSLPPGGAASTQVTGLGQPAGASATIAAPMLADDAGSELPANDGVDMDIDTDAPIQNGTVDPAEELPPPLPKSQDRETVVRQELEPGPELPPLPSEAGVGTLGTEKPPLPIEQPQAAAGADSLGANQANEAAITAPSPASKRREYSAQPLRAALDPLELDQPSDADEPADTMPPLPPEETEKKRKRERGAMQPGKKRKSTAKVAKTTSNLINKWTAVRKDLESDGEEEGEEELSAEALERKRLKQAEEWRIKQLHAGMTPEENANFQPVAGDWRSKVKAAAKKAGASQPEQQLESPAPPKDGRPDLAALTAGLPAGWKAMWDPPSKDVYYGNPSTKACPG